LRSRPNLLRLLPILLWMAAPLARAAASGQPHPQEGVPENFPLHPAVGEVAPSFSLKNTEGHQIALGEFLGRGYLVLAFGSSSSASFRKSAPELDRLALEWERMEVKVVVVYTREAHPAALHEPVPKSYQERVALARDLKKGLHLGLELLVDDWTDPVHKAYGAMPDGAFLLDSKGTIVARQVQANASALDHELRRLLKVVDPPASTPSQDAGK
jgi:peroxiredoxin